MDQELPRHEKIRFRRDEIADLGALPSSSRQPPLGQAAIGRGFRILVRLLAGVAALFLVAAAAVYAVGLSGFGAERLRAEAEATIEKLAGVDVHVAVGPARITLDGSSFLALQVDDVSLETADGKPMLDAGMLRFGVRLLPLLSGEVRLTSAKVSDARIETTAMPSGGGTKDWAAALRNEGGLIDPDKVADAVFAAVNDALDAVRADSLRQIELENVDFVLPPTEAINEVNVVSANVLQSGPGSLELSSQIDAAGRTLEIAATAVRDIRTRRVSALGVTVELPAVEMGAAPGTEAPANSPRLGALQLRLAGTEGIAGEASRLTASLALDGSIFSLGSHRLLPADVDLDATLLSGSNKIALDRLSIRAGRSSFDFNGSIGPKPPSGAAGEEPSYRYDLVSDGSTLAPQDSPEPALRFIAKVAGVYGTQSRKLTADTIALKSGPGGEVLGTAAVQFAEGKEPGVSLALNVHGMPVSHIKQLWPWFSAGHARLWVLENLFGGRVVDGNLQYQVAVGRAGNGVPLGDNEVFGHFQIEETRFDTAGRIPPIRDANGVVDFHGNDVNISLSTGTVYMPSGRIVAASNGTLKIVDANRPPVIGALDIDVAGEAAAIVELSSYEPINAMRHIGLLPEDVSGTVTGNVKADIPLQSGVETDRLNWLVALDYQDLSLAKPYDGQLVSDADGTIIVDKDKAEIAAKAKLNGVPAELDLVEPLDANGPPASRKVALVLDDKAREALMPGLSTLLSGTVKVALEKKGEDRQTVEADLTGAKLNIPWAGWSKGTGVPANVTFTMATAGDTTTLTDFDLDGKSFSIKGTVALAAGELSSARFSKVTLNRGDDVAVSVKRSAKGGYAVDVKGDVLDARSLIKQFTADAETATKGAGSDAISVSADVKSLTGFHDERLSDLKLNYGAAGSKVGDLKVSAATSSGAAVDISNSISGGRRALDMKSADAGAILRFLNIYEHMQGGAITLALAGSGDGPMMGQVDARDFTVVDEPKLASIVSTPADGQRSLNQAVRGDFDASSVRFERGFSRIEKGDGYLKLAGGVLRGPMIGTTFQGTLYDRDNNMDMTGTFMPIYGVNRIFGELPIVGALLGNGRDRGLIGVTYRLSGNANKPRLDVNPLSIIAPGIFRSIFEFR